MTRMHSTPNPDRGPVPISVFRYLDKIGDGTGDDNAIEDYSGVGLGATDFKIAPAAGEVFRINRMIISITAATAADQDKYGGIATLANGITVKKKNAGGDILDLTNGSPIVSQSGWASLCFDITQPTSGAGNDHLHIRWTFLHAGAPIRLVGDDGEFFAVTPNDDLALLVKHQFHVQGLRE